MIKQTIAKGIVLSRTNYQEADRIITILTAGHGKIRVLAKGVRKSKSKLAGGVELFSVAEIGFIQGKGELGTLTSSRLITHFGTIVQDIQRTTQGYELIRILDKATEDQTGVEYYDLLLETLQALDDHTISLELITAWFDMQLLRIGGHTPNLKTDTEGRALESDKHYVFDHESMAFYIHPEGIYSQNDIKVLRLLQTQKLPALIKVEGLDKQITSCRTLLQSIRKHVLHV